MLSLNEEVRKLTAEQSRLYKPMIFRKVNLKGFDGAKTERRKLLQQFQEVKNKLKKAKRKLKEGLTECGEGVS